MSKSNSLPKHKKVTLPPKCPIPTEIRISEFGKAHACISDIIADPSTGVCYVKCVAGGKEIDIARRYLIDDKVEIDDVTFTKNPNLAAQWILSGKNVGVYTGIAPKKVIEDNVVILDIDLQDVAPDEEPAFMAPREVIDRVAGRTLTIETRSGGLQCIFRNAMGALGSPKLRYIDHETGYLKDAGDTRIKHAYALFAGSYVAPDKVTSKRVEGDVLKPVKKPLPHADGLYRAIHAVPIVNLTHELLDEMGLVIGGNGQQRAPRTKIVTADGNVRTVDASKVYSSYGHRKFEYTLTRERINALKAEANPDRIRNKDGKTLDSLSLVNTKIFNLIKPRDDYTTRGVTTDESESAENMALAYEMRKLGFESPDMVAMAILIYHPREKNYEIRSNGISYLADTVAGAFDRYNYEQSGEFTEDELLAAENAGRDPQHIDIASGRGYSYLYDVAKDDPRVRFETWREFPPLSPDAADITLWRGDPRSGKSWHGSLYLSQHLSGNYITHRHEILDGIFSRLVDMTSDTTRTIVWLEGKHRCCPRKEGMGDCITCSKCDLRPSGDDNDGGIPFLEYQSAAKRILLEHRAICKNILLEEEVDYCPYYILKLAEEEADYCLTVAPFISPLNGPDAHTIQKREYLVIDEDPTIDAFYPAYPALYEHQRYGFASKWDTNHLVNNDIPGQCKDVLKIIEKANPQRVTKVNKVIRDICNAIIYLNDEIMKFSVMDSKGDKEQEAFVRRVQPKLPTFASLSREFKEQVMKTFVGHLKDLAYISTGDPLQYVQPFLFPAPTLLVWQRGSHAKSPKQILYLMSDHTPMFEPEFEKMLIIGATESEVFVNHIRGDKSVCRVDLELFPYQENYLLMVAVGDSVAEEERIVRRLMSKLLERNTANRDSDEGVVPFIGVTGTKEKQNELLRDMLPHGKIIGLGEHDGRDDVVRYYEQGYPVLFYANGTVARGVDLPEYDVLFFVDGSFATPRYSSLLRAATINNSDFEAKIYANLRASKVSDEGTNSAYRAAPLYTRKQDCGKLLVIARTHLRHIYQDIYKHSARVSVDMGSVDRMVDLMSRISSKVVRTQFVSPISQENGGTGNPICMQTHLEDSASPACDYGDLTPKAPESHFPPTTTIGGGVESAVFYHVESGIEKQEMAELLKGICILAFSIKRDRKAQKTYDIVLRAVVHTLKRATNRLSREAVVTRVSSYASVKNRKVSAKVVEKLVEEMILEGHLLCDETPDFRTIPVDGEAQIKRWISLNKDSPAIRHIIKA